MEYTYLRSERYLEAPDYPIAEPKLCSVFSWAIWNEGKDKPQVSTKIRLQVKMDMVIRNSRPLEFYGRLRFGQSLRRVK